MNIYGTFWTRPGTGATVGELLDAVDAASNVDNAVNEDARSRTWGDNEAIRDVRTSLALDDLEPIQEYDVERIFEAVRRVRERR